MRLISQDGKDDVPYETNTLYVEEGKLIAYGSVVEWVLGVFDSDAKAMNELKKIRTAYASGRMIYKIGE